MLAADRPVALYGAAGIKMGAWRGATGGGVLTLGETGPVGERGRSAVRDVRVTVRRRFESPSSRVDGGMMRQWRSAVRRGARTLGILGVVGTTLTGCDDAVTVCTRELRIALAPRDTAIAVGESFTPAAALSSCGGRERLAETFTWVARDPAVAGVDPTTGRVTGRAPGATAVEVSGARYGRLSAVGVTVRPGP